ncbi:MAG: DUF1698 domain-containing protein, partial [Deltaproteobacteria bacterium]|nr:DUF1698 domain-containing protein [Deltaproteobacteria bacterium]
MIDYTPLYDSLNTMALTRLLDGLPRKIKTALAQNRHGKLSLWQTVLANLPTLPPGPHDLNCAAIRAGATGGADPEIQATIRKLLMELHPWRKGPYDLHGVFIDTEWRSDLKWDRLQDHLTPLKGRVVLDVGCGNGYHCWRMRGCGAELVLGIDPFLNYIAQYGAVQHFLGNHSV